MTTIPLFILMGQFAFNSGISRRLYDTAYTYLGSTRGGLAMATVSACTAFGAVCGSSPATAATMATVGLPEMKRYNYSDELATGAVASGGGLGMIMPPSVVLIVYGVLTEQSIGALFVAGIFPAVLMTILFIISIYVWCRANDRLGPPGEKFSWAQRLKSLTGMGDTLAVFILVMGGMFIGLFTPTEAAAVGAFGVLAVSLLRRQMTWEGFVKSLYETLRTSCMVLMLTIPIFYPVVTELGYDPIWFGVIIVLVTQMGVMTPPVGINVYVVFGVAQSVVGGVPLESIFKGIVPFLLAVLVGIIIMTIFPQIILYLPNLMY